jgi:hypothetical protein
MSINMDADFDFHLRQHRMIARCRAWLAMVEEVNSAGVTVKELHEATWLSERTIVNALSHPRYLRLDLMSDIVFAATGKSVLIVVKQPQTERDAP